MKLWFHWPWPEGRWRSEQLEQFEQRLGHTRIRTCRIFLRCLALNSYLYIYIYICVYVYRDVYTYNYIVLVLVMVVVIVLCLIISHLSSSSFNQPYLINTNSHYLVDQLVSISGWSQPPSCHTRPRHAASAPSAAFVKLTLYGALQQMVWNQACDTHCWESYILYISICIYIHICIYYILIIIYTLWYIIYYSII